MAGAWVLRTMMMGTLVLSLAACGDPPEQEKKLPMPKGENSLDDIIKKLAEKPPPEAKPAELAARPDTLKFADTEVGQSQRLTVVLANDGDLPLTLRQLHVAGQGSSYRLSGECQRGLELRAKQSCKLDVAFHPVRDGSADAELVVGHTGSGGNTFLPLMGTGVSPVPVPAATAMPVVEVQPYQRGEASMVYARTRQEMGLVVDDVPTAAGAGAAQTGREIDYTEAGLPGITSTFPVDRQRVITADRYIPAVLENTLNSQIGGRAMAVVERHVYGSDGHMVLIPAGSRVIGDYASGGKMGLSRIDIVWTRILRPDGVNVNIDSNTADVMGRAGVPGDLDSRFWEKYGSSLMTSVIAAGAEGVLGGDSSTVSTSSSTTTTESGATRAGRRLGNDLSSLAQRMINENVDITPVLVVPQGTRLNIIPNEDIWLRDPNRITAVTPPKGRKGGAGVEKLAGDVTQALPGLLDLVNSNPALLKSPQAIQQLYQSQAGNMLRDGVAAALSAQSKSTTSAESASK